MTAFKASLIVVVLLMAAASSSSISQTEIEIKVDARKREILQQASWCNEFNIQNRLFCLRPSCHRRPLLHRIVTTTLTTVLKHNDTKPLPEVVEIFGNRHSVNMEDFFLLYCTYVQGHVTEFGALLAAPKALAELV